MMKKTLLSVICLMPLMVQGAWGAEFCVNNSTDLQTAFTTAASNSEDDTIKVVQGTYTGDFTYNTTEGHSFTLLGGYTAGCTTRELNPVNTVLDGGKTGSVLYLLNQNGGDITVDGFTMQNGVGDYYGGGVFAYSSSSSGTAGNVTITNNIVTGNSAPEFGGGVAAYSKSTSGTAGNVTVTNNTITGNSVTKFYGGGVHAELYSGSGIVGTVTLTNNTITGNTANGFGGGAYLNVSGSPGGTVNCYNNIIWGNTGGDILLQSGSRPTNGYNNDYTNMVGSWTNSANHIDADPLFVGSGDYHLRPGSPCIDTGLNNAPGIPSTDFEGNYRILDGDRDGVAIVDMGAYEYHFASHCVNDAATLQTALTDAESNGQDNVIKVVQGTYNGNFTYESGGGRSITLEGGYTAGCIGRVVSPANTILDGLGSGTALFLSHDSYGGDILVDGFTIRNGKGTYNVGGGIYAYSNSELGLGGNIALTNNTITGNTVVGTSAGAGAYLWSRSTSGNGGNVILTNNTITGNTAGSNSDGGGAYAGSYSGYGIAGDIFLTNNTIQGNSATYGGGVMADSNSSSGTASGNIYMTNNIITGNTAFDIGGGVAATSYSGIGTSGNIYLINNTITGNNASNSGGGANLYSTNNNLFVYNNIIWGNTATTSGGDIYLEAGTAHGYNNDYHSLHGAWDDGGGNIDQNPLFVAVGGYHLQQTSPCIDAGLNSAPFIPATDFEGNNRIIDGNNDSTATVDMGADEFSLLATKTPSDETVYGTGTLINKYQPSFQWTVNDTFKNFTILFSTSSTDFSKTSLITQANIPGTKQSYTPSLGVWKKIMTSSNNGGMIRKIYWKVVGTRANKSTQDSDTRNFLIDIPYSALISSPYNEAVLSSGTPPTFIFTANNNIKLMLEISVLKDFGNSKYIKKFTYSVKDPNVTTSLTKTFSSGQWNSVKKLVGTAGYFRILAWDGINRETISEIKSFTIQ
ncbi:MAG: choice-of-anchor Q domain-containing protein [Syntrophales bacterium]